MTKYRKRPVVVEAVQVDGTTKQDDEMRKWSNGEVAGHWSNKQFARDNGGHIVVVKQMAPGFARVDGLIEYNIKTLEGTMKAEYGDWIIKGVKGEFYPCKPDIFEMTYEAVSE